MKDYYLFPQDGSRIKVEETPWGQVKLTMMDGGPSFFTPEKLEATLLDFIEYMKKHTKKPDVK